MKKKRRLTVLQKLREWVLEENIRDESVVEERYYQCVEQIDPVKAAQIVMRQRFLKFIRSIRNKRKSRRAFPYTTKQGVRQIHIIPGTTDFEAVAAIDKRLAKNQYGNRKTRRPVRRYQKKLAEQLSLNFVTTGK